MSASDERLGLADVSDRDWDAMSLANKLSLLDKDVIREVFGTALAEQAMTNPGLAALMSSKESG